VRLFAREATREYRPWGGSDSALGLRLRITFGIGMGRGEGQPFGPDPAWLSQILR